MQEREKLKIGVRIIPYSKTYGRYGADKFQKIRQHGYSAADYNIYDTDTELYTLDSDALARKIAEEREDARLAGIEISQIHGPWRWPAQDSTEEDRAERMEKMKRAVEICSLLRCKYMVLHPIMPYGTDDLKSGRAQDTWNLNLEFFKTLLAFAKEHNVTICLENLPMLEFSMATPEKVLAFVQQINDDNMQICLDTGHVALFANLSVGDEVRRLGKYLKVLHIHDNLGKNDNHLFPTKGIINWRDFMTAIYEIGYDGVLSLETSPLGTYSDEQFEEESIKLCQIMQSLL